MVAVRVFGEGARRRPGRRSVLARLLPGGFPGLLLLAAAIAVATLVGCSGGNDTAVGATPGKLAPSFSGQTLQGATLSLDSFRGKPVFLIYATSG